MIFELVDWLRHIFHFKMLQLVHKQEDKVGA